MNGIFNDHAEAILKTVHPDMVKVLRHALQSGMLKFTVTQGLRTREAELALWRSCHNDDGSRKLGAKWETDCNGTPKGQTSPEGIAGTGVSNHQDGHAVDLAVYNDFGGIDWSLHVYVLLNALIMSSADHLGIPVKWGGKFPKPDSDHWELDRDHYPAVS